MHRPLGPDCILTCQDSARDWVCPTTGSAADLAAPPYLLACFRLILFVCSLHIYYCGRDTPPCAREVREQQLASRSPLWVLEMELRLSDLGASTVLALAIPSALFGWMEQSQNLQPAVRLFRAPWWAEEEMAQGCPIYLVALRANNILRHARIVPSRHARGLAGTVAVTAADPL